MKLTHNQQQNELNKKRLLDYIKTLRKSLAQAEAELEKLRAEEQVRKTSIANPLLTPELKRQLKLIADCNGLDIKNAKHFKAVRGLYLTQLN